MQTFVGLLRGINVGGNRKLPMAELRGLCEKIGILNPKTYIQSGNIVFTSEQTASFLESALSNAIEQLFGFRPDVLVIDSSEYIETARAYPFETENHKLAHIQFLKETPLKSDIEEALSTDYEPDKIAINGRAVYLYMANGVLESPIDFKRLERILKTSGTARNWRTVQKLVEMIEEI